MPFEVAGRCYCGTHTVYIRGPLLTATYCHCVDCRRVTGAPVAAFAAYAAQDVELDPPVSPRRFGEAVRWFCLECGSALAAAFSYLPGQTYVPLGVMHAPPAPQMHCHADAGMPWIKIDDDLPRHDSSGRNALLST